MKNVFVILLAVITLSACNMGSMKNKKTMTYPETMKQDVTDDYFGTMVKDPYRWLENDTSPETEQWVMEQNKVTNAYLGEITYRKNIEDRLTQLWDYPKNSAPYHVRDFYLCYKNNGLQNQSVLYIKNTPSDEGRILLDPNTLSEDGTVSLASTSVSKDGKYLAYGISRSGSDWKE